MIASETRLNARKALTGKWGKAALIALVYAIIVYALSLILALIPIVGSIISAIIGVPLSFGIIVSFMNLKRDEEVSYVGFFTEGFSKFGKVWLVTLRTILKMIVPIILIIIFYIIMFLGLGSAVGSTYMASTTVNSEVGTTGIILMFIGIVGIIASTIWAVVKYYLYALTYYILKDNPDMEPKAIVEESERLMKGHRASLFCLQLSFIGWAILATIPFGFGIGCYWLIPQLCDFGIEYIWLISYIWLIPYILVATIVFYENLAGKTSVEVKSEPEQSTDDGNAIKEDV